MRITESQIRRIIREEASRILREANDPRLDRYSKEADVPAHQIASGLRAAAVIELIGEEAAADLRQKMFDKKGDFDDGMAVIRQSKRGDGYDIFLNHMEPDPINDEPLPTGIFGKMGILLGKGQWIGSFGARRRHVSGY